MRLRKSGVVGVVDEGTGERPSLRSGLAGAGVGPGYRW